ncbi:MULTISPECIES: hypothetical protein [Vibrio]|uniref:DUF4190 domain-containing protein n=1 Tax=bacterium 19PA01SH03 TaxID=2920705 RepID=A0AAU6SQZ9_UNCXX|nr:hypothetical protein [Vibrio injensis]EKO3566299.1 hypothetical protein [Vibrio metschnikovii]EKO3662165.1 hypothetical protein [Vibrio metschnikovii]
MRLRDYIPSIFALSTMAALGGNGAPSIITWGLLFLAIFVMPISSNGINKLREAKGLAPRSRLFYLGIGGGVYILLIGIYSALGINYGSYKDSTIADLKTKPMGLRHDIFNAYLKDNKVPESVKSDFYACFSHNVNTKNSALTIDTILGWCKDEHENKSERFGSYINFDNFESNISLWNGSYRPLEAKIKSDMHDKDSYEHISTRYRHIIGSDPRAVMVTDFRGKNIYGAMVKQTATAHISLPSGLVIEDSVTYSGM